MHGYLGKIVNLGARLSKKNCHSKCTVIYKLFIREKIALLNARLSIGKIVNLGARLSRKIVIPNARLFISFLLGIIL